MFAFLLKEKELKKSVLRDEEGQKLRKYLLLKKFFNALRQSNSDFYVKEAEAIVYVKDILANAFLRNLVTKYYLLK